MSFLWCEIVFYNVYAEEYVYYSVHWNAASVPLLKEKKSESLSQRHIRLVRKSVPTPYLFKELHLGEQWE